MNTYSISQINKYIKNIIETDAVLGDIMLKGEISNFKAHNSGHLYFTLKDETSVLGAVMFKNAASALNFRPSNGMKVVVKCRIRVYEPMGGYQAYVTEMQQDGIGDLHIAFEQLKQKLAAEGLFNPERKKRLPHFPKAIGIVTSPTGAAIQDMLNILGRRWKYPEIYIYPALVQGEDAPKDIISGIKYFNDTSYVDVIIIGRGGGSIEDLWGFNDEGVAREVAASRIPIISAVGHEIDFTISDFAADLRAATPSEAAERVVPLADELRVRLKTAEEKLCSGLKKTAAEKRIALQQLDTGRIFQGVLNGIDDRKMRTDNLTENLIRAMKLIIERNSSILARNAAELNSLSPLAVLGRGYSITFGEKGKPIMSVNEAKKGDNLTIKLADGEIGAKVAAISKDGGKADE